jgi:hypothetical protein
MQLMCMPLRRGAGVRVQQKQRAAHHQRRGQDAPLRVLRPVKKSMNYT